MNATYGYLSNIISEITDAIEAGGAVEDAAAEFDIEAIAHDCWTWDPHYNGGDGAFIQTVDDEQFWACVMAHQR